MQIHLFGPGLLRSNFELPGYARIQLEPGDPPLVREFARDVARRLLHAGRVARVDLCRDDQELEWWEPGPDGAPTQRPGPFQN